MKNLIIAAMLLAFFTSCSVSAINKKGEPRKMSNSRAYFSHHPKEYVGIADIHLLPIRKK